MAPFDPTRIVLALLGGVLIGSSASLLLVWNGRVAGITGILGRLLRVPRRDTAWRVAFIAGLLAVGGPVARWSQESLAFSVDRSLAQLVVAGLLVGYGTRLANGCTSGHGVAGIARLAPRSLVATGTFMAAGFFTVFVVDRLLGSSQLGGAQ